MCCCQNRESAILFMLIFSVISLFFGIITALNFASSTKIYKEMFKEEKESDEDKRSLSSSFFDYQYKKSKIKLGNIFKSSNRNSTLNKRKMSCCDDINSDCFDENDCDYYNNYYNNNNKNSYTEFVEEEGPSYGVGFIKNLKYIENSVGIGIHSFFCNN